MPCVRVTSGTPFVSNKQLSKDRTGRVILLTSFLIAGNLQDRCIRKSHENLAGRQESRKQASKDISLEDYEPRICHSFEDDSASP
jgi:sirohydrochlorin ferrochelatase